MLEAGNTVEDARYVLPRAIETQLVMTMNARERYMPARSASVSEPNGR